MVNSHQSPSPQPPYDLSRTPDRPGLFNLQGATKPAPPLDEQPSFMTALGSEARAYRSVVTPATTLRLVFQFSGQTLLLPLTDSWIVGRATLNMPPSTPVAARSAVAQNKTISREHCMFRFADNHAVVVDLKSTNGTYLNGQRLEPYRETILAEGDELRMATLRTTVSFIEQTVS